MKVTIQDIAKEAGVSKSSVSLVLNEKECRISEETRRRILEIAERSGYKTPKERKKSEDTGKTIGVIYQGLDNFVHTQCMKGIEKQAELCECKIISCDGGNDLQKSLKYLEVLKKIKVDGIILIPSVDMNRQENLETISSALKKCGIEFLLLDQAIKNVFCDFVTSDNKTGATMAMEYLIENGHQRIGIITGNSELYTTRKRLEGCREALNTHGIEYDEELVYRGNDRKDSGYAAADFFVKKGVEAIFAMNDQMAMGVYQYAQEKNIAIGNELSIVGFDYSEECADVTPSLTSVRQEGEIMGKKACEMIVRRIGDEKGSPNRNFYYVPRLIVRNSVRCKVDEK